MVKRTTLLIILVTIFSWFSICADAGSEVISGIDTGITSVDNIPGAIYFDRNISDHYGFLRLHWGRYHDLQPGTSYLWSVDVEKRVFNDWAWSDTLIPGLQLRWSKKFGIGPRAPRLSAFVRYQYLKYRDEGCDGPLITGGLRWERRLADRFRIRIGTDAEQRRTARGSVYDLDGMSFHVTGISELTEKLQLSAGIGRRHGDVAIHDLNNWSPAGKRWWASNMTGVAHRVYQYSVDTDFYTVELALINSPTTSTRLAWRRDHSNSSRYEYRRDTIELSLNYKF